MAHTNQVLSLEGDHEMGDAAKSDSNGADGDVEITSPVFKSYGFNLGRSEDVRIDREKISDLQAQVVRLRNDLEKGETVRQQLEYELAVSQKAIKSRCKELTALELELTRRDGEYEAALERLRNEMLEREHRIEEEKGSVERTNNAQKERLEEVEERMQRLRGVLEEKIAEAKRLAQEKGNVTAEVDVLEGKLEDLRVKFVAMSEQSQGLRAEMAERNGDLAALRAREALARQELQAAVTRCRQLEEEAERGKAGQLEQRFNGELVQLKLREAESQLHAERHAKAEAVQLMEEVSRKLHEMETAWEEEKKLTSNYRLEFEKIRAEHLNSRSCLTEELEEKRRTAIAMKEQLERQKEEFEAVQDALANAQQEVSQKDERHRKLTLELALLLDKAAPAGACAEGEGSSPMSRARRNLDAEGMLEQLRKAIQLQRKAAAAAAEDLTRQRAQVDVATREARSLREQVRTKDKALQSETEKNNNSAQELRTLKKKVVDSDRRVSELRAANSEQKRRLEKATEESQEQKAELQRVRRGRKAELESVICATSVVTALPDDVPEACVELASTVAEDGPQEDGDERSSSGEEQRELSSMEIEAEGEDEERIHFISDINQRLSAFEAVPVSGAVGSRQSIPTSRNFADSSREFTWTELKGSVSEQLAGVLSSVERQNEKIQLLEESVRGKERYIEDLRMAHEAQITKYDALNHTFSVQKKELEEHYNKLIQDMQSKSKQSQALADQAWERINASGTLQLGLEAECASLRSSLSRARAQNTHLLSGLALLLAIHVPLVRRAQQLTAERRLLSRLCEQSYAARRRLAALGRILHRRPSEATQEEENETAAAVGPAVARFRVAAVAVLAANRLLRFRGSGRSATEPLLLPSGSLTEWLRSEALLRAVDESLTALDSHLEEPEKLEPHQNGTVRSAAVRCIGALLDRVEADFFPTAIDTVKPTVLMRRTDVGDSLASRLAHGLALNGASAALADSVLEVEQGVLALSRRLVAADNLATQLREEADELEERLVTTERRTGCIQGLRRALEEAVPAETHRRVTSELASSRSAEAAAQELLEHQAQQLASLTQRVEELSSSGGARDTELRDAAEMLSRSRVELKKREQGVRQMTRQNAQLLEEKAAQEERLDLADRSVAAWRYERDLCLAYLTAVVQTAAEFARLSAPQPPDVRSLLEREATLVPSSSPEPPTAPGALPVEQSAQVIACRNAVRALIETALRWQRKAIIADEKVAHYRRHVALLKRELAAACARAVECPEALLSVSSGTPLLDTAPFRLNASSAACPVGGVRLQDQSEC